MAGHALTAVADEAENFELSSHNGSIAARGYSNFGDGIRLGPAKSRKHIVKARAEQQVLDFGGERRTRTLDLCIMSADTGR
jgi:hypothetical protein